MTGEQARPRGGDTVSPPRTLVHELQPYPEYKDSSVEWLGKIPKDWTIVRTKNLFKEIDERSIDGTEILLSVSQYTGVSPRSRIISITNSKLTRSESLVNYKLVKSGDLVINIMLAWNGSLGVSNFDGIVSPAYCVYRLKNNDSARYFHYLFRSSTYLGLFENESTGVVQSRLRLYTENFFRILSINPPSVDREAIGGYLKSVELSISQYVHAKRKLIELLNGQKRGIINQAVTRGIDPNVRLKPSGIEWLGDVPEHWGIEKISSHTISIGDGLHGTPKYVENSPFYFINGNNLIDGVVKITTSTNCIDIDQFEKYKLPLDEKTVLLSINGTIGSVALYENESVILGKSVAYFICRNDLSRTYLFYLLQSQSLNNFLTQEATGTTILNLSLASIRDLNIPFPAYNEQKKITEYLDKKIAVFSDLVEKTLQEINLIHEYHSRLVSDVVTGKVDVRSVEYDDAVPLADDEVVDLDAIDEDNDD